MEQFPTHKNNSSDTNSPDTRTRSKKVAKRSPHKKIMRRKSGITAKKKLAYTAKGQPSATELFKFTTHKGFDSEKRILLRKYNTLGYGNLRNMGGNMREQIRLIEALTPSCAISQ